MAVFLAVVVFSVPDSTGTRGGGVGVIPIIGVTRTTHITRQTMGTMGMGTRRSPEEGVMLALLFPIAWHEPRFSIREQPLLHPRSHQSQGRPQTSGRRR